MAQFNPLDAGMLLRVNPELTNSWFFLGSCFAFREPHAFVTAGHCVDALEPAELRLVVPRVLRPPVPVETVARHPSADVAVVRVPPETASPVQPFWNAVGNYGWGEEFFAYGYAEDRGRTADLAPTPRLFKGHYQRFFDQDSFAGYRYTAGEMSIPSPPGLSGGPLFRPGAPHLVTALAAENTDSTTTLEAVEDVTTEGNQRMTHYQRVISYGVAVMLDPLGDWIDEHLRPFDAVALAEAERRETEKRRLSRVPPRQRADP